MVRVAYWRGPRNDACPSSASTSPEAVLVLARRGSASQRTRIAVLANASGTLTARALEPAEIEGHEENVQGAGNAHAQIPRPSLGQGQRERARRAEAVAFVCPTTTPTRRSTIRTRSRELPFQSGRKTNPSSPDSSTYTAKEATTVAVRQFFRHSHGATGFGSFHSPARLAFARSSSWA